MNTLPDLSTPECAVREYEKQTRNARECCAVSPGIGGMIGEDTDARRMAAFLLHFSALSIPITKPVEGWIRRAGDRCAALGLAEIGRALNGHAKAEAGHHKYHIDDFAALVPFWNARWSPQADPATIQGHGLTAGGERYCRVHEKNIAGATPFCQLAIEYEIELLPVEFGSRFVQNCVRLLGEEVLCCMSFVTSHIEFDVGHTKFNAHFLGNLLVQNPDFLGPMAAAGAEALEAFTSHLTECWQLAEAFGRES